MAQLKLIVPSTFSIYLAQAGHTTICVAGGQLLSESETLANTATGFTLFARLIVIPRTTWSTTLFRTCSNF